MAQLPEAATLSRSHRRHALSSEQRRSVGYLSAETAQKLADLGKTVGASLPQVLISLVAAYYQRVSGVNDLVFLMPVSGRINAMLRNSLAPSVNAVPVRTSFHPQMTSAELFVLIRETVGKHYVISSIALKICVAILAVSPKSRILRGLA